MRSLMIGLMIGLGWVGSVSAYDAQDYTAKKAAGLVSIGKVGESYVASENRYDQETGAAVAAATAVVTVAELQARKTALQTEITAIDTLIADLTALP